MDAHHDEVDILLTERQVAEILQISDRTLQSWRSRRRVRGAHLPWINCGGSVRYRHGDVIAFLNANTVKGGAAPDSK